MKKSLLLTSVLVAFVMMLTYAQSPQSFTYQAVARNASGAPIANQSIGLRISIINNSTPVYTETFTAGTNAYGMFTVTLGNGAPVSGSFFTINWSEGSSSPKELKVELDPTGGTAYTDMGTTSFNSVPYALVSDKSINMTLNELTDVNVTAPEVSQVLQWNGSAWVAANGGGSIQTNATLSGDGSSGNPLKIAAQSATNGQVLQFNGSTWIPATVTGGVGDNWGTQFVQKTVTLDGNGTAASPLKIAQQGAANGETLIWNGSLWGPGRPTISVEGTFAGAGTPALPLKLSQQGAVSGQALMWNGSTWVPGTPFSLPFFGSGVGGAGFATFSISNPATAGPSRIAVEGLSNGGAGVSGTSDPAGGKGVSGTSFNGIGIYGASTNGLAANFDGNVAVFGQLKVFGSNVLKSSDSYLFDQSSSLHLTSVAAMAIPGLDAMSFTIDNSASAATPAKVTMTFNTPLISTSNNPSAPSGEKYQLQLFIKQGATIIKQVNCNDYVAGLGIKSFSYTLHQLITTPGTYTASVLLFKSDGTASKDITLGNAQVQIQVMP